MSLIWVALAIWPLDTATFVVELAGTTAVVVVVVAAEGVAVVCGTLLVVCGVGD